MQRQENDWRGFLRFTMLTTTGIENIRSLYRKITARNHEPISYFAEIIREWEQFAELCFEMLGEQIEPLIVFIEAVKACYKLKEYAGLLALGVDIHIKENAYLEYKAQQQVAALSIRVQDKRLPNIANFLLHPALAQQLHDVNQRLMTSKLQHTRTFLGEASQFVHSCFHKPATLIEILRVFRPLILILMIYTRKFCTATPLLFGLGIDLLSVLMLHRKDGQLSVLERSEKRRRCLGLLRYLLFPPVNDLLVKHISSLLSPQSFIVALLKCCKYYSILL